MNPGIALKGRIKVALMESDGSLVREYPWQSNLLLDRGLNAMAVDPENPTTGVPMSELFSWGIKGTGVTPVKEVVSTGANYTLTISGNLGTLTRTAGTRNFVTGDIGKLVRQVQTAPFTEGIIVAVGSVSVVTLRPVGDVHSFSGLTYSAKNIVIYSVGETEVEGELGRTPVCSSTSGDNSTLDTDNIRLMQRTLIFDSELPQVESLAADTYNFIVDPGNANHGRVQRASGSRNFAASDIGKYIEFPDNGGQYGKIISQDGTSPTLIVYTDRPPIAPFTGGAGTNAKIYGYVTYGQIGFSNSETAAPNILVTLDSVVNVIGPNPETDGQRLKVTYQFQAAFTPAPQTGAYPTQTTGFIAGATSANMATSQAGSYTIEAIGASRIDTDGGSILSQLGLEPCSGGEMALSTTATALMAVGRGTQPDRTASPTVSLDPLDYVPDSFTRLYQGSFGINDGVGSSWRVVGVYDSGTSEFLFTYLFNTNQQKLSTNALTLRFSKSWNRDLS